MRENRGTAKDEWKSFSCQKNQRKIVEKKKKRKGEESGIKGNKRYLNGWMCACV